MSTLYKTLAQNIDRFSALEAVIEDSTRWTYRELLQQVDKAAAGFQAMAIQPGQRVGLMLFNQKEFLTCFFALRKLGAVVVPINIQMLPQDIAYVIQNAGLQHMVVSDAFYANLKQLPLRFVVVGQADAGVMSYTDFLTLGESVGTAVHAETADTDLAFLLYTSGTTGYPKGVMLSEKNVLTNLQGFEAMLDFGDTDRMILALPLFHAYGLIVALTGLMAGAALTLIPKFHPKSIVEALVHEKATILPLVPTLYSVILDLVERRGGVALPDLRFCISGGASLPTPLLQRIESVLHTTVLEGYGMTETSPVLTVNDPAVGSVPGSVGKPLPNVQLKIVREDGTACAVGEVGEILAKGDNRMMGYYNLPDDTQAVMTADGWIRTGDLGHVDAQGYLFISGGRKKDIIIKAGENISPVTIEQVLYQIPAIHEVAVVGIPDEKLGEDIAACLSVKEGHSLTAKEVLQYSREHLSPTYIPARVEFFDELPKNPTGKIAKKLIREALSKRLATAHS